MYNHYKKWSPRVVFFSLVLILILLTEKGYSQDVQIWLDGFVYKEIGESWEYEANLGLDQLIQKQGWTETYFSNTFSWQIKDWYGVEGSLELHYTRDEQTENVAEIRPWLAQKFSYPKFFQKIHLDKPYVYMRLDQRFLFYPESDTSDTKTRLRVRLGGRFLLNSTNMKEKTFYLDTYFENFFDLNGEAIERHAAKNKTTIGLGYIFNSRWQAEFQHYIQRSRNTFDDSVVRSDIIFQLKVKYFLDG